MIPEAAVEAAAKAHHGIMAGGGPAEWGYLDNQAQDNRLYWMRAALEAAWPHMLSEARAEALEEEAAGLAWLGAQGNTVEPNTAWAGVCACIKILRSRAAAYRG